MNNYIIHYGIPGQRKGIRNGPPYPLSKEVKDSIKDGAVTERKINDVVKSAIESGLVVDSINKDSQKRHLKGKDYVEGRSFLDVSYEKAEEIYNKYRGTGEPILDNNGNWTNNERVTIPYNVAVYVDPETGRKTRSNNIRITYSNTGSHMMSANKRK